jgi:hypothetical protein
MMTGGWMSGPRWTAWAVHALRGAAWLMMLGCTAPAASAPLLSDETPRVGVACHLINPEELDVPVPTEGICADAVALVERWAGAGRGVVRLDLRDEAMEPPTYPVLMVSMEMRADPGGRNPRLLLRVAPVLGGRGVVSTQLPPMPVHLTSQDWAEQAHASLDRMIGFLVR